MDRTLARGLFLMAISLAFGLQSLNYPIGHFSRAGAGLFPLMISSLLFVIALIIIVRSRLTAGERLNLNVKNIGLILLSLCGLALLSQLINMIAGIFFMVFVSAFAGKTYSVPRNLKVAASLVVIAYGFHKLLGLNLPLP
jgi:hypothetical protein